MDVAMTTGIKMRRRGLLIALVIASVAWPLSLPSAEIRFRTQARCAGSVIRLRDVAEVLTPDKLEREKLAEIELGPYGGARQAVAAQEIQNRLAASGVRLADHQFAGAAVINVSPDTARNSAAAQRPLSRSALQAAKTAVADAIAAHLRKTVDANEPWNVDVLLTDDQAKRLGAAAGGFAVSGGHAPWVGRQQFTLSMPSSAAAVCQVEAQVTRAPRMVVAINAIARGDRINPADVMLAAAQEGTIPAGAIGSIDDAIGQEAVRNIAAGEAIDDGCVRAPVLVNRGDVVIVYARAGGINVHTRGVARQEGARGNVIRIELSDRRSLLARVSGRQEVEVLME
jgi:flagella basal body P-ring formation protein FlgA